MEIKSKNMIFEHSNLNSTDLVKMARTAIKNQKYPESLELYQTLLARGGVYEKIARMNIRLLKLKVENISGDRKVISSNIEEKKTLSEDDQLDDVMNSEFWDKEWYEIKYSQEIIKYKISKKVNITTEQYYIKEGWRKGHKPSQFFEFSNNPFPKNPKINHISYFLRKTIYRGYHFRYKLNGLSEVDVNNYLAYQNTRGVAKGVIYKCITGGYNEISNPPIVNKEWDYVCFSDAVDQDIRVGIWLIKPLIHNEGDKAAQNRWHKFFPQKALPEYFESIYLDGNVDIRDDYIFDVIESRNTDIILPRHFARNCTYDEANTLLNSERFKSIDKDKFNKQISFLNNENFPHDWGMSENNLIYRRRDSTRISAAMELWWWLYQNHSQRDQLGLAYSLWKYNINLKDHLIENCRIDFKHYWVSSHEGIVDLSKNIKTKITPIRDNSDLILFSTNDSFYAYLGIAIESLIYNSNPKRFYDVVVLCTDLSDINGSRILSLDKLRPNVSVRLFDMKELLSKIDVSIFHVEGYVPVETYYKFFLVDITEGYRKCLYLDSDIFINDDIGNLLDIDLEGNYIGATPNIANIHAAKLNQIVKGVKFADYLESSLGIKDYTKYFQAGVLSMDLEKLRPFDLANKCIEALRSISKPLFFDQCVFNRLFHKKFKVIDVTWNHVWYLQDYSYLRTTVPAHMFYAYARSRICPSIIHFAGKEKYYSKPDWKLADIFWDFVSRSTFKDFVLEDCNSRVTSEETKKAISQALVGEIKKRPKLLIHLHLFYPEQLDFMLSKLDSLNNVDYDLYVTQVVRNKTSENLIKIKHPNVIIYTIENVGYDIFPFLTVLKNVKLIDYDFILKIHTKNARIPGRDSVYGIDVPGHAWRDELVNSLIGTPEIFDKNIGLLNSNTSIGLISASKFYFDSRNNNEEKNYNLPYWRARLKIDKGSKYVGGSMFLARAYPFERVKHHGLTKVDFTNENGYTTKDWKNLAHVFERLFGFCVENENFIFYEQDE